MFFRLTISFVFLVGCWNTLLAQTPGEETQQNCPDCFHRELRSLNSGFPMQVPQSLEQWEQRRKKIQQRILVSQGLWPMPAQTPTNAVVEESMDCDDFKVYRVTLESYPGFYVTGNLFIPQNKTAPMPGVLYAHGHWADARFYRQDDKQFEKDLEQGAEQFDPSGRYPIQAACVGLARIGCVAFAYDMVGYSDSIQIPHLPGPREHMNTKTRWGYFSPQAELHLQNMMGLQTYNSIRVLDWFSTLPFVDPQRIGMTGASGGGTQTMILSAIDDRIHVSFPAVMVSTDMQGGCTCENAPYLRIGMGNIDIAAAFAPKPLAMTAADDWTKEMETCGFPELKKLFTLYGVPENTALFPFTQFPHNYNQVSREAMYCWMNKHLKMGLEEPITEKPFTPFTKDQLTVWTPTHPAPVHVGEHFERDFLERQKNAMENQMQKLIPTDAVSLAEYLRIVGGAFEVIAHTDAPGCDSELIGLFPEKSEAKECVLFVSEEGQGLFYESEKNIRPSIRKFLEKDMACVTLTLPGIGTTETCLYTQDQGNDVHERYHYLYTFGYNDPLFVLRSREITKAINQLSEQFSEITVVGLGAAGKWAALAVSQDKGHVRRVVIDTEGYRFFERIDSVQDPDFLPGVTRYFDLPGMISLCVPRDLLVIGEKERLEIVDAVYRAFGAVVLDHVTTVQENLSDKDKKLQLVFQWVTQP